MKILTCAVVVAVGAVSAVTSAQVRPERPPTVAAPKSPAPLAPSGLSAPVADESRQIWTFRTHNGGTRIRVDARGRVELTDDEKDVQSVSSNGSFDISSKGWSGLFGYRYVVRANSDGTITRSFSGGVWRPTKSQARAWIADAIQHLVRNGFGAEARVARILASQGPHGVLDEISRLDGDSVTARYFTLLFKQSRIDRMEADRALRLAAGEIGSDFELARVLTTFAEEFSLDEALAPVFVDATNAIGSDFQHARVLRTLMTKQPTPAAIKAVLASTPRIGSDFEKARVLLDLAQRKDIGPEGVLGIVQVASSIGSDSEQSRVLLEVVSTQPIDEATRQALLVAAGRIGSDHHRSRVMSALLSSQKTSRLRYLPDFTKVITPP